MRHRSLDHLALGFNLMLASTAFAQWSSDPMVNLALADGPGDQVQAKVRPLPEGGWWVSWFNNDPNDPPPPGYDVYLQRLDAEGVEQLPHNGILIADLSNSSTQDYGLDVDADQNALLAFLDTREGSTQQVTAVKVSPLGELLWGELGVQLTADSSFHGQPKIAATFVGNVIVAWISASQTVLQKLDPDGQPLWDDGVLLSEPGANYSLADLHATADGGAIVSWVRDTGFSSDRWLMANKVDPDGQWLWNPDHVRVFDGGSLQIGSFPPFIPDGSEGALFAWYSSRPSLQVFAQHLGANGEELFGHNGVAGSADTSRVRVSPAVSFRPDCNETFLFWTEENSLQSLTGLYGQKFDSAGGRQWGETGLELLPLGSDQQIFVQNIQSGDGPLVFWVDQRSLGSATLEAIHLDSEGQIECPQFPVSSAPASKSRLSAALGSTGVAAIAWQDTRAGNSQIFIQNVNSDCSLGSKPFYVHPRARNSENASVRAWTHHPQVVKYLSPGVVPAATGEEDAMTSFGFCAAASFLAIGLLGASAQASGKTTGPVKAKSFSKLAFGPDGILFVGDSIGAKIYALDLDDRTPVATVKPLQVGDLEGKFAGMLGIDVRDVLIHDMAVNPISKHTYFTVSRGRRSFFAEWQLPNDVASASVLLRVTPSGEVQEVRLDRVKYSWVDITNPVNETAEYPWKKTKQRADVISDMKYVDGKLFVAGLSNEEFSSTMRIYPFPFRDSTSATSLEIYHGSHGKYETDSPVRAFLPVVIHGKQHLLASYLCTPMVLFPIDELKDKKHLKGTTIAEFGSGSYPLDMVALKWRGKDVIMVVNSARGILLVAAEDLQKPLPSITTQIEDTAGIPFQRLRNRGILQAENYGEKQLLLLVRNPFNGEVSLTTVPTEVS